MAPISSTPDHSAGEDLRLELEALNQALQYRSHARCKSRSPLSRHAPSPSKHPPRPKPTFKVPFRSAALISCHPSKAPASPRPAQPLPHQNPQNKGGHQHYHHLEKTVTQNGNKQGLHPPQHGRKSFWRWPSRPFRAISHLLMGSHRRSQVLFSLHVHHIEGIPVPLNGLRLTVRWICKDQGVQTMPSRIFHGIAEFGETLCHRCTMYGTRCPNDMIRYDAKPSTLSIVALDVDDLELGKHHVDLSKFLVQDDVLGKTRQEESHTSMSYKLSGMAKGSTLIVSFSYDHAHRDTVKGNDGKHYPTPKQFKEASIDTRSLEQGLSSIDISDLSINPPRSEPCADATLCHNVERLDLDKGPLAQQDFPAENNALEAASLSDIGVSSSSFEFKPNLESILEEEHQHEFTFSQSAEAGPASFKNFESSATEEEGLLMCFPFINPINLSDDSIFRGERGCKLGTQLQSDQQKPQERWDSSQEGSIIGQWVHVEESKFMKVVPMDFDDEVDLIAEEFLRMLRID